MDRLEEKKKIILDVIAGEFYVPMKIKELAILLNVPKFQREELHHVVNLLESEGKLVITKRGKIMLPEGIEEKNEKMSSDFIEGIFESNQRGFGFIRMEDGEDIFIPGRSPSSQSTSLEGNPQVTPLLAHIKWRKMRCVSTSSSV